VKSEGRGCYFVDDVVVRAIDTEKSKRRPGRREHNGRRVIMA
jgi:hypothetical protein